MRDGKRRPPSFRIIRLGYAGARLIVIAMFIFLMIGEGRIRGVDLTATALILRTFRHFFYYKRKNSKEVLIWSMLIDFIPLFFYRLEKGGFGSFIRFYSLKI